MVRSKKHEFLQQGICQDSDQLTRELYLLEVVDDGVRIVNLFEGYRVLAWLVSVWNSGDFRHALKRAYFLSMEGADCGHRGHFLTSHLPS